jgi:hypothetical protein
MFPDFAGHFHGNPMSPIGWIKQFHGFPKFHILPQARLCVPLRLLRLCGEKWIPNGGFQVYAGNLL